MLRHVVLLVPGYAGGSPMMWGPGHYLRKTLNVEEHRCSFSDYGIMKPIPEYARELDKVIKDLDLQPGDRLDLVAFSMGGLVCRYWLEKMNGRAAMLVTLCTPHYGTTKGEFFAHRSSSVRDLQPGSMFLKKLNSKRFAQGTAYHSIRLDRDSTIRPAYSALLPGAANYELRGRLHSGALYRRQVWKLLQAIMEGKAEPSGPQEHTEEQRKELELE